MTIDDVILGDWTPSSYADRFWQHYLLGDFAGYCLVDYDKLSDVQRVKTACFEAFGQFDEHPLWSELSKELAYLIYHLFISDNDMYFVDEDDPWLETVDLTALKHEVSYYGLDDCITFYDNDAVICLYTDAQTIVNVKEPY